MWMIFSAGEVHSSTTHSTAVSDSLYPESQLQQPIAFARVLLQTKPVSDAGSYLAHFEARNFPGSIPKSPHFQ